MEHKHGCVVLHHGKIMSTGYNYDKVVYKYKLLYKNTSCSTHAEMSAIFSLKNKKASSLLVIRVGKDGLLRDSKPCKYCFQFIQQAGIKKIYFSTNNQEIICTKTKHINISDLIISGSNKRIRT